MASAVQRNLGLLIGVAILFFAAAVMLIDMSYETAMGLIGISVLLTALLPGPNKAVRALVIIAALVVFAFGGWLDLEGWRAEWAKSSPHFLGPPR